MRKPDIELSAPAAAATVSATDRRRILLAVVIGSGVVFLDGTVVNVALGTIGNDLPALVVGPLEGLTYVTTGYLAVLAALLVLGGALGDAYGRRRVFGIGLAGFGITSAACGLAPSMEALVLARLAQGATGALLVPGSLAIITATWEGEERGRAIGTWAAATSAVTVAGPLLGGLLVQGVSWRAAFLVNVPLVIIGAWALRAVPESRDATASRRFDWTGAAVIGLAVGGLAFGATRGQQTGWTDPVAFAALGVGIAAIVAFPVLMSRRRDPLVPPWLFRSRVFGVVNLATFVVYGALYMTMMFQQLFLQAVLGYTPTAAALATVPPALLLVALSSRFGRLAGRTGARLLLTVGPTLMAGGMLLLVRVPSTSAPWLGVPSDAASLVPPLAYVVDVLPAQLVYGLGLAVLVAPLSTALMGSVPARRAGLAAAINNAVSRAGAPLVGAALFVAISATFYPALASLLPGTDTTTASFRAAVVPLAAPDPALGLAVAAAAREASTASFHLAMAVAAALFAVGAAVGWFGLRPGVAGAEAIEAAEADAADATKTAEADAADATKTAEADAADAADPPGTGPGSQAGPSPSA
jgi:EmrB/QacA subfamily drug resistance transporter